MQYTETLPDDVFSHHIESYWQFSALAKTKQQALKLLLPTCTFNILFTKEICWVKTKANSEWLRLLPGATFVGQTNTCIQIRSKNPQQLMGVRFKPFAFAHLLNTPICELNNSFIPLSDLFEISSSTACLIQQIIQEKLLTLRAPLLNDLMSRFFKKSLLVDEKLRAQLNFIMDRRGGTRIRELLEEFKVSKVTLHKHFIRKVGLPPKKVAQIWRMNYLFQLKEDQPEESLTTICLMAGFYDQAHFIKDFKLLFGLAPRRFFAQNRPLVKVAHHNISRRFSNQYDPR